MLITLLTVTLLWLRSSWSRENTRPEQSDRDKAEWV